MGRLSIALLGMAVVGATVTATDYCSLDCNGAANSACNCSVVGHHCVNPDYEKETVQKFRIWMVEMHNDLRNQLALGREHKAGMKEGVANMHTIDYDLDLEHVARCYMNKCQTGHDKCRRTAKFKKGGQNLFYSKTKISYGAGLRNVIRLWYKEIDLLTKQHTDNMTKSFHKKKGTGHFTQLVWARTTHVGCARYWDENREQFGKPDKFAMVMACNYGPAGNVAGESLFKKGKACSKCGDEKCNSIWKGLCGKVTLPQVISRDLDISFAPKPLDVPDLSSIIFVLSAIFFFWL